MKQHIPGCSLSVPKILAKKENNGNKESSLDWKVQTHIILEVAGFLLCTLGEGQVSVICRKPLSFTHTRTVAPWDAAQTSKLSELMILLVSLLLQPDI